MSTTSDSGVLVKQAKESLLALDPLSLADNLEKLFVAAPVRWQRQLMLSGFWPEPLPTKKGHEADDLARTLNCVFESLKLLHDRSPTCHPFVRELRLTIQGFQVLRSYYLDVQRELNSLDSTRLPTEVQLHRLVAFLEGNSRSVMKKWLDAHRNDAVLDPFAMRANEVQSPHDDSKHSFEGLHDHAFEIVELAIRFALHTGQLSSIPRLQSELGPYHDPGFKAVLVLASIWHQVNYSWADMRFRGWQWSFDNDGNNVCGPLDAAEYLREQAGAIRHQNLIEQKTLFRVTEPGELDKYVEWKHSLAESIVIPEAGVDWDGNMDLVILQKMCDVAPLQATISEYVENRHYGPLLNRADLDGVTWYEWVKGKTVLYCLAHALNEAATLQVSDSDLSCMRQVVIVKMQRLSEIIHQCTGLSTETADRILKILRFDQRRKHLDIWDQPLIPLSNDQVFLVPSLITSGNPARALENLVSQWGGATFDLRGTPFEEFVRDELLKKCPGAVEQGVIVDLPTGGQLQFDIIAYWEGYILLLEAKCEKAVFSAADYHRASGQIEYSIDQLVRRRLLLPTVWTSLKNKAPSLNLPEECVPCDKVLCVSITNIMDFSGLSRDNVVVTDDDCFFRFFGDRILKGYVAGTMASEVIGTIRELEQPHPSELMAYLEQPIQIRRILKRLSVQRFAIPAIPPNSPGFYRVHDEFEYESPKQDPNWTPMFLSLDAYWVAVTLCYCQQSFSIQDAPKDASFKNGLAELLAQSIVYEISPGTYDLALDRESVLCSRLPDGRFAIGENNLGRMERWIQRTFPNKEIVIPVPVGDE